MFKISQSFRLTILAVMACGFFVFYNDVLAQKSSSKSEPLKLYVSCKFEDDLQVNEIAHRSKSAESFRTVETVEGTKKVSVIDGYRMMFAYPKTPYFFANVKVEQSSPQDYAKDKETVIEEMKYLPLIKNALVPMAYGGKRDFNGYETYGADRAVIDKGGVLGIHVLFSDTDHVIITVYFLNQGREKRKFQNIEEYRELRDRFLNQYTSCIKEASSR
jgi:hypothetical protein